ncbi:MULTISPECIES: hypothetical protein [Gammaproteobacteria]|uniref:hypothetical protein n=1 Tax=Gammaproteobacteria TaxID=1236 RepID=UPI000DCFC10B|nr:MULTISPECIES: hypothetical protein [Gammaproteobacteria]RTE85505.1 hypothetical protein DQX04_11420 [Aliidiomarina sp. B3213]TCZ89474.1 hypothetical protein EYQ95_11345 [Lysobacter sp. N42]
MSENDVKSTIEIDIDLIESAGAYLEKLPKTPGEVLEKWIYLGTAAERQLTEDEQLLLMSGRTYCLLNNNGVSTEALQC